MHEIYHYQCFNLTIKSEILLPELIAAPTQMACDVAIKRGHVASEGLNEPVSTMGWFQAAPHQLWLAIKDIGRFLILNGREIIVDAHTKASDASIRTFLLGSCLGGILIQRDIFPLHANAIQINDYAISFIGESGIGKSTLAGAFIKEGFSILGDDVCALDKNFAVMPSVPHIKLWQDASDKLNIDTDKLSEVAPLKNKFLFPIKEAISKKSVSLKVIYHLTRHDNDTILLTPYKGLEKLKVLSENTYRQFYIAGLEQHKAFLTHLSALSTKVELIKVKRPAKGFKLNALVEKILLDINQRISHLEIEAGITN